MFLALRSHDGPPEARGRSADRDAESIDAIRGILVAVLLAVLAFWLPLIVVFWQSA